MLYCLEAETAIIAGAQTLQKLEVFFRNFEAVQSISNVFFIANHKLCISRALLDRNYRVSTVAGTEISTKPDNYQLEWHNYRSAVILRLPRNTGKPDCLR